LSSYDFELETAEERKIRKTKEALEKLKKKAKKDACIDGFHFAKKGTLQKKFFPPPIIPHDFQPIHRQRKSRFDKPVDEEKSLKKRTGRHALTVQERQVLLGEQVRKIEEKVVEKKSEPAEDQIQERVERIKKFVQVLQSHEIKTENNPTVSKPAFQPFMKNPEKQERYEKYLTLVTAGFQGKINKYCYYLIVI
jgi:G patch domain-containing protein 1